MNKLAITTNMSDHLNRAIELAKLGDNDRAYDSLSRALDCLDRTQSELDLVTRTELEVDAIAIDISNGVTP